MDNKAHVIQYTYHIYVCTPIPCSWTVSWWAMASYKATESYIIQCGWHMQGMPLQVCHTGQWYHRLAHLVVYAWHPQSFEEDWCSGSRGLLTEQLCRQCVRASVIHGDNHFTHIPTTLQFVDACEHTTSIYLIHMSTSMCPHFLCLDISKR